MSLSGAFWVALGATQTPNFNAQAFFENGENGVDMSEYYASFGRCYPVEWTVGRIDHG